jgi:hypothetical protein
MDCSVVDEPGDQRMNVLESSTGREEMLPE